MKIILQVVSEASVVIDRKIVSEIEKGLVLLVGVIDADTIEDIQWLCKKVANMRVFSDEEGVMNLSVKDVNGEVLVVSQFTLHASTKKGNRPSYMKAAKSVVAIPKYEEFVTCLEIELGKKVQTGVFGADMKVSLVNNGPVTIVIDSKSKE